MSKQNVVLLEFLNMKETIYELWLTDLYADKMSKGISQDETRKYASSLFNSFIKVLQSGSTLSLVDKEFSDIKSILEVFSRSMATKGQTQTATAKYIYSLKSVVSRFLQSNNNVDPKLLNEEIIRINEILDTMGLYTFEYYVKERERIIQIQQEDMLELSTPVIKVWNGILAVPLIGTLDSKRTQIVMQKLLDTIIATSSKVAILDITGVPTVDTYVANHLINTTKAAKLVGAETIITGISPSIAQVMVHLGINLSGIVTRAVMEDGLKLALEMCNYSIVKVNKG